MFPLLWLFKCDSEFSSGLGGRPKTSSLGGTNSSESILVSRASRELTGASLGKLLKLVLSWLEFEKKSGFSPGSAGESGASGVGSSKSDRKDSKKVGFLWSVLQVMP